MSASFSSSSRFFSAVICSSFCRASKRSFCTSEGSAAELAAGIPPLAACNTSFMVGFFLPNRPDILLGGSTGLAAEAGVGRRAERRSRRVVMGAKSTCQHMRTCSRDAQSRTVHETQKRGCFSLHDYRSLAHKFSVAFFVHVVQQRNPGAPVSAQHALTWHYG